MGVNLHTVKGGKIKNVLNNFTKKNVFLILRRDFQHSALFFSAQFVNFWKSPDHLPSENFNTDLLGMFNAADILESFPAYLTSCNMVFD